MVWPDLLAQQFDRRGSRYHIAWPQFLAPLNFALRLTLTRLCCRKFWGIVVHGRCSFVGGRYI